MFLPSTPEIQNNWRYEQKYQLSYLQYYQVKNAFLPYVQLDPYSAAVPSHRYFVRSLYFDTPDYQAYSEKLEGDHSRYKLRIRTYTPTLKNDSKIRIETKLRQGGKTGKIGTFVTFDSFCGFMERFHWKQSSDPVLIEFERNVHAHNLRPKVLVEYYREGYQLRSKDNVRVTFDHRVQSVQSRSLTHPNGFFRPHYSNQVVLEIKYQDREPDWLKTIVQVQSLKVIPNSKYCQGIELTQLDLVNHTLRL